jgi:pimeloyl-ACP methyl ester carboxylesterase
LPPSETVTNAGNSHPTQSNLSFLESGSGLPVIFLHGFCETKELWLSFMEPLSKVCRVILMDLPGFGGNPPLEVPLTIADMAEQVMWRWLFVKNSHPG